MAEAVYTASRRPYAHQQEALDKMRGMEAFALFMEMRTGKTKVTIDDYGRMELAGKARHLLVIAPGGVYRTWEGALQDHLSADLKKRLVVFVWETGMGAKKKRAFEAFLEMAENPDGPPCALLINIEAVTRVKYAGDSVVRFARSAPNVTAIDESTIIGNDSSQTTKFINGKLAHHCTYRRILSGLPNPTNPMSLYSQLEFLDWRILGNRSFFSFRSRYAVMKDMVVDVKRDDAGNELDAGRKIKVITGYRDLDHLRRKIAPYSYRKLLSECYDLPPKMYSIREVKLTEEQERLYSEMKLFFTTQLSTGQYVTASVVIAQMIRLHQILCGHTRDEEGNWHEISENRTSELLALLEEFTGKAIIWCSYDNDVQKVVRVLEKRYGAGVAARFWGGNRSTREEEEARFLGDPECRFMVATAAAGGRGRTWMNASLVVYYSCLNNLDHRAQSEERAQGIGKTESVGYIDLVAPGTVEEKFLQAIRNKIDLAAVVHGDAWREWVV